jgi:flagellar biosynthesis/type III secretory pathway protein FliH
MTNNKQKTAVEGLIEQFWNNEGMLTSKKLEKALEIEKDQMEAIIIKECAEQSTLEASKYAEGYKEGYNRALELIGWYIKNITNKNNEQR